MKTLLASLFLAFVSATINAHACDKQAVQGWHKPQTEIDHRVTLILEVHGKDKGRAEGKEYQRFECDGRWRYRVIDTGQRRKV